MYKEGTSGTPILKNNCVFGNTDFNYSGLLAGTGDISVDPLFVNRAGGDYHLSLSSPCLNAGLNSVVGAGWLDIDGNPRI